LHRCRERGFEIAQGLDDPFDNDEATYFFKQLDHWTGTGFDVLWHHYVNEQIDPYELQERRAKQKAYLGRYGRFGYFDWADHDVTDLIDAYADVNELVHNENEEASASAQARER
jgi:hypothetical protein